MQNVGARVGACALVLTMAGGCAKGTESSSFTFGPVDPTNTTATTSNTSGPIDPTTGGNVSATGGGTGMGSDDADGSSTADRPGTTGDDATGPGDSTSTGPGGPVCGDGMAEPGEECDGADLAGMTCIDVDAMFTGGTLACDPMTCTFDVTGCSSAENPIVVCQAVGAAIVDNSLLSNTISLAAGQTGGTITDVDVEVELDHTWLGDLDIDVDMGGTSVQLFSDCGSEDNLHATFDDSGGVFSCASSDINATVQPAGLLSAFNGNTVMADWTLNIEDTATEDTGTLAQWCVTITWM